jgi:cyclomaltodextrinase / maltogenic alpha-amylase / neopullulanase
MRGDEADIRWFDEEGELFPRLWHHDPERRTSLDLLSGGRVVVRLRTESDIASATLVMSRGREATGVEMTRWGHDVANRFWEAVLTPEQQSIRYSFALRTSQGAAVYLTRTGVSNAVERLDRWEVDLTTRTVFEVPEWARGAVIYQIFPDRFANGDPGNDPEGVVPWGQPPHWLRFQGGDLDGIVQHLDHLDRMGVDVVYLNPIFVSPSTHGYDTIDYGNVDDRFGGNEALRRLVAAVHARGMRIILDVSFNHVHPRFFAFADVVEKGEASPYNHWFVVAEHPPRIRHRPHLTERLSRDPVGYREYVSRLATQTGIPVEEIDDEGPLSEPTYEAWYGVATMPRLDVSHPDARGYVLEVATSWLEEFDIDGWRMDVARYVDDDLWPELRRAVRSVRPDAYLLCEVMGDAGRWLEGDAFDGTMNYTFRDLAVRYFAERSLDGERLVTGLTRMLAGYPMAAIEASQNLLSSHDRPRFLHLCGGDAGRLHAATIFQLTMPGAPGIYYGDEVGMTGGDDPGSRGTFPWGDETPWDRRQLAITAELGSLRRRHPALRHGDWAPLWWEGDGLAFLRTHEEQRALVVLTRADPLPPIRLELPAANPVVLWGSGTVTADSGAIVVEGIERHGGVVVAL